MTIRNGIDGYDFLDCVQGQLTMDEADAVMTLVARTRDWLVDGHSGKRSHHRLAHSAGERKQFSTVGRVKAVELESAMIRAFDQMSRAPLLARLGVREIPKQSNSDPDTWASANLDSDRETRTRKALDPIVSSKFINNPVMPGATASIKPGKRPDDAMRRVLQTIYGAAPSARVHLDHRRLSKFDERVSRARSEGSQAPLCFRVAQIMSEIEGPKGPVAFVLPADPIVNKTRVSAAGDARDIQSVRMGYKVVWEDAILKKALLLDERGELAEMTVKVRVSSEPVVVRSARAFSCRVALVSYHRTNGASPPFSSVLVATLGENEPEQIAEMAVASMSQTEAHPLIKEFLAARDAARIFLGEQRNGDARHADRALASIAFAAVRLDPGHELPLEMAPLTP